MSIQLVYEGVGNDWIINGSTEDKKKYKIYISLTNFDTKHHLYKLIVNYKNIDGSNIEIGKPEEIYIIGKKQQVYENFTGKGISSFKFSSSKHKIIYKYNINAPELGTIYGKYYLKLCKPKSHCESDKPINPN